LDAPSVADKTNHPTQYIAGVYPFAGKECARALAMMSTEEADCNGNLEGLGFTELDVLRDWEAKFHIKYPIVGSIVA